MGLLARIIGLFGKACFREIVTVVYASHLSAGQSDGPEIDVKEADDQAVAILKRDVFPQLMPWEKWRQRQWLGLGLPLFVVVRQGRLVHFSWVHLKTETAGRFELQPGDVFIGPCYTAPDFRGQGIYPRVLQWLCREMARRGHKRAMIATAVQNAASISGIEKAGFRPFGRFRMVRIGPWLVGKRWLSREDDSD